MLTTGDLFAVRKPLGEICTTPASIISVYSLEKYVWDGADPDRAKRERKAELRTVEEFQVNPVRHFLMDILQRMAAPYARERRDNPIGQGYWLQAEFGSGKSHLLCFLSALALGDERAWNCLRDKEQQAGRGRRESLYTFWENGLKTKSATGKGLCVVGKTLVGAGSGTVGVDGGGRPLTEYVLNAVRDQYRAETGGNLSLYPQEMLADRFLQQDLDRYRADLERFLKDPTYFDPEEQQSLDEFLKSVQSPQRKLDCGRLLWRFYTEYLDVQPNIVGDQELVLKHMVEALMQEGYQGLLLVLDEISLFAEGRTLEQRSEDEQTLVVLANRLAKIHNLPIWTVCAAQQKIVTKMGVGNILSDDRLKLIELLKGANDYFDIVLSRVRTLADKDATHSYYEYYKKGFTWPSAIGEAEFTRFFPFHRPALEVLREITYGLTTCRSAIHIMHQTLNLQIQRGSEGDTTGRELIRLWELFDEAVRYEEDAGSTHILADIKTKWHDAAQAFERCQAQVGAVTRGPLKKHQAKAVQILQTLFLYHIAQTRQHGLTPEEIANSVLVPVSEDATPQDNIGDYETLADALKRELPQIQSAVGEGGAIRYRFTPEMATIRPKDEFDKARAEAQASPRLLEQAWDRLLKLDRWEVRSRRTVHDMAHGKTSLFTDIAGGGDQTLTILYHGRPIAGIVGMYDLPRLAANNTPLPRLDSANSEQDFAVFISTRPLSPEMRSTLLTRIDDPRVVIWSPGEPTGAEHEMLLDFAAYVAMIEAHKKDVSTQSQEDIDLLNWVANALQDEIGRMVTLVRSRYERGVMASREHSALTFTLTGDLKPVLTQVIARVLDALYLSKEIHFENLPDFRKEEAVKVINGIVKTGKLPVNAPSSQDSSAAINYGIGLKILKRGNERVGNSPPRDVYLLDTGGNPFVEAIWKFVDDKLDAGAGMSTDTLYMNFTGLNGPDGVHYGLSRRLIQLYLLCLVQQGKARLLVGPRSGLDSDKIDYANLSGIAFSARILDALEKVQKVEKPQNWDTLRPYAEKLLAKSIDASLDDAGITRLRGELNALFAREKSASTELIADSESLFEAIKSENPCEAQLTQVARLFDADLADTDDIDAILEALERAFGYLAYRESEARQSEVDDLANRLQEYRCLREFVSDGDSIRAAYEYANHSLPDLPVLAAARDHQAILADRLKDLKPYIDQEILRKGQLIGANPPVAGDRGTLNALITAYEPQYRHLHSTCMAELDGRRATLERMRASNHMRALQLLERITALQPGVTAALEAEFTRMAREVFGCPSNTEASVRTQLRGRPVHECGLSFENNEAKRLAAQAAVERADRMIQESLDSKLAVFLSPGIRDRLQQGAHEPLIADLLVCDTLPGIVDYLTATVLADESLVDLINRYLKQVQVRHVRLSDFKPSVNTVEKAGIAAIVDEFQSFLEQEMNASPADDSVIPVLQLE